MHILEMYEALSFDNLQAKVYETCINFEGIGVPLKDDDLMDVSSSCSLTLIYCHSSKIYTKLGLLGFVF